MTRIAQQLAAPAEQREIDAPRIDAHAIGAAMFSGAQAHPTQQIVVQSQHVPMEGVERSHRFVGEPRQNFQTQLLSIKMPKNGTAALGAEIKGKDFGHKESFPQTPTIRTATVTTALTFLQSGTSFDAKTFA